MDQAIPVARRRSTSSAKSKKWMVLTAVAAFAIWLINAFVFPQDFSPPVGSQLEASLAGTAWTDADGHYLNFGREYAGYMEKISPIPVFWKVENPYVVFSSQIENDPPSYQPLGRYIAIVGEGRQSLTLIPVNAAGQANALGAIKATRATRLTQLWHRLAVFHRSA